MVRLAAVLASLSHTGQKEAGFETLHKRHWGSKGSETAAASWPCQSRRSRRSGWNCEIQRLLRDGNGFRSDIALLLFYLMEGNGKKATADRKRNIRQSKLAVW